MQFLKNSGHLIVGLAAMACATTLAALHDVTGSTAIEVIVAVAGVTLGAHVATN